MTKYTEEVREIRKLARVLIPELLEKSSYSSKEIIDNVQKKFPKKCDDSVKCICTGTGTRPEWKHQILWAIQDCKYDKKIIYDGKSKKYMLTK